MAGCPRATVTYAPAPQRDGQGAPDAVRAVEWVYHSRICRAVGLGTGLAGIREFRRAVVPGRSAAAREWGGRIRETVRGRIT
ncbi:hypothetical protein HEK616_81850 (plasmid) [Streptomyces nigrescens]|uniref:Uncharacterized protein n=1 Tax=Streptomyces nigrescens TaxID=1920 RepID=A0ABN6R8K0_STRNI|nr:hypothetical protein HEK616_81850 [Streptomyces nigrescens]